MSSQRKEDQTSQRNVLGGPLVPCGLDPMTGFWRDGCCRSGREDVGMHLVCAVMDAQFLQFSSAAGNDLSTPRPEFGFAGLKPGDTWCLCAPRWKEAYEVGMAPRVILERTHEDALRVVELGDLLAHAVGAGAA